MNILYVHQNYPAQFGHIAKYLIREKGWNCSFVSKTNPGIDKGVRKIQYFLRGQSSPKAHMCGRFFENSMWSTHAVYEALKPVRALMDLDLIVGHSSFVSTLLPRELFPDTPIIN